MVNCARKERTLREKECRKGGSEEGRREIVCRELGGKYPSKVSLPIAPLADEETEAQQWKDLGTSV